MQPMRFKKFMEIVKKLERENIVADDSFVKINGRSLYEVGVAEKDIGPLDSPGGELNLRGLVTDKK